MKAPVRVLAFLVFACVACASPSTSAEGWIPLFNGTDLTGWKPGGPASSFRVEDGAIVAAGDASHLYYSGPVQNGVFGNFELQAQILTHPGANSGVYFHTAYQDSGFPGKGFEAQIHNTPGDEAGRREVKKTGSLYGVRNVYKPTARDGEWFAMHLTVTGKRIQVRVNGTLLVDYVEPAVPPGDPRRPRRRIGRGTFALQCHDPASRVLFKHIRVKPLPDTPADAPPAAQFDELDRHIAELQRSAFPLVDFHAHIKGPLTLEDALALSRKSGIGLGIAVNCGLGFPITTDADIDIYLKSMSGRPVFLGMQAEGREWTKLFSRGAIARFDYVFTDAMTFTDHRGKRTRLWMKDEVEVPDPQAFMDMLVERIVAILDHEPIDIYVNPTFLPAVIAAQYDELWTARRMDRVVSALARNGVALEINSRYRIPSAAFIRKAKQAGVKFTLGTNNSGLDLGRSEYGLEMVRECGLNAGDMWLPAPPGRKPVERKGGGY